MSQKYFIGVDVSKEKIDLKLINYLHEPIDTACIKNVDCTIQKYLLKAMKRNKITIENLLICCEATGIYNHPLQRVCTKLNVKIWVEHPYKIKKAVSDFRGKSDKKDAARIAEYACRFEDKVVPYLPPSVLTIKLKAKTKVRETLISIKQGIDNQLRESKSHDLEYHRLIAENFKKTASTLEKEICKVEREIQELINSDEKTKKNVELMCSIPGIGRQNAINFIMETENFSRFSSAKHLACYAGVVPFENESGTIIKKKRVSKMANQKLKKLIHLAAMAASRSNSDLKLYYIRKVKEGKNKMSVINAIRNKLIHRIWAVIQRQTPYAMDMS